MFPANIAMCNYRERVTTGQTRTNRQAPDKVIPMYHFYLQATTKLREKFKFKLLKFIWDQFIINISKFHENSSLQYLTVYVHLIWNFLIFEQ